MVELWKNDILNMANVSHNAFCYTVVRVSVSNKHLCDFLPAR